MGMVIYDNESGTKENKIKPRTIWTTTQIISNLNDHAIYNWCQIYTPI